MLLLMAHGGRMLSEDPTPKPKLKVRDRDRVQIRVRVMFWVGQV